MLKNINWKSLLIVVLFLVGGWAAIKYGAGKASGILGEVKNVRVGGYNFLAVGLMAMVFLISTKFVFTKWEVPGLSNLVRMA